MSELLLDAKQWAKHPWNAFGKKVVGILQLIAICQHTSLLAITKTSITVK